MEHVLCMVVLEHVNADPNPQSGAVEPVSVEPAEILALEDEPTEEINVAIQTDPPTRTYRDNEGRDVVEALTLVGWVEAPRTSKELLDHYGVDLRFATHDPKSHRWNDCLFSEAVAELLEELAPKGEFPFAFEAAPTPGRVNQARTRRGTPK